MISGAMAIILVAFVCAIAFAAITVARERGDTYKGVRNFRRVVLGEMQTRWLHGECLPGHGRFCSSCRKREQCYKELEERMKRVIDAEQESEANDGSK